ncbi:DUF1566 domain-containing protein [Alishewanella sp. 16-MA]|uniref:DUF1566 domain-containing protein n=1 Tax=Alishewanella maricola TaxID=2795740 RepID=A0ABS8C2G0_9ALTE|nr:DUF1566 domain-containing protein [Alishewanella maricola]MCB5226492.1 DUF1566 domain-containing protein [Alishewanella maricola]
MLKKLLVIATLVTGLISGQASAAFVATDWKSIGDGLATLDTQTGLEWLDLTETGGKSINEVKALLDTVYAGWRLPTHDEIKTLAVSLFPTIEPRKDVFSNATVSSTAEQRATHSMFGQNVTGHTYGYYEVSGSTYGFSSRQVNGAAVWFSYHYATNLDKKRNYEGIYLVSDGGTTLSSINDPTININNPNAPINMADVSAPAGLAAAGVLILMMGARRKVA